MPRKPPVFQIEEIDLNLLRVFEAIYRQGSITAAAQTLEVTQPSLSHSLAKLRRYCDDPLFLPTGRGVIPTAYADSISEPVLRNLAGIREALKRKALFDPTTARRVFSLAMSDVGQAIILPVLARYLASNAPGISVRTRLLARSEYAKCLESGELDLAFGDLAEQHKRLYQQTLFRDSYVCLARLKHPLFGRALTVNAYRKARHIVVEHARVEMDALESVLSTRGIQRDIALEVPQYLVVRELVANSDLLATVPGRLPINDYVKRIAMHSLPFSTPPVVTHQYWHRFVNDDPANIWLRRTIRSLVMNP